MVLLVYPVLRLTAGEWRILVWTVVPVGTAFVTATSVHRERAIRELRNLETEIEEFYRAARLTDDMIGLHNAVRAAIIVTLAAWRNRESIGCHYRE